MFASKPDSAITPNPANAISLPFSVQERDIDLLLIEQLYTSPDFVNWFSRTLGLNNARFLNAQHSVYRQHGETDVLVTFSVDEQKISVMVENKIGAVMQPGQCERYHLRGQALCSSGTTTSYLTVLFAPRGYLTRISTSDRWDHKLSHEEVADWFENQSGAHAKWRHAILIASTSKLARAYRADFASDMASYAELRFLKAAYHQFIVDNYPNLSATEQLGKDKEYFIGAYLPNGARFKHSFFHGEVSLIFHGRSVERARQWIVDRLPHDAWVVMHGSELHVRVSTEVLDPALSLNDQIPAVRQALDAITSLAVFAAGFV